VLFPRSINSSSNPTPRSLHQLSDRIQARAVRRMGELIKTFPQGERTMSNMSRANLYNNDSIEDGQSGS